MVICDAVVKETENHIAVSSPTSRRDLSLNASSVQACAKHGITREQLLATPESLSSLAYSRYVLDTSSRGDLLDCRVVTAPCLIGYGVVGKRLNAPTTEGVERDGEKNQYWDWVKEYGGDWYQGAVQVGISESFNLCCSHRQC